MRKFLVVAAAAVSVVAGGAGFALLNPLGGAGAQNPPSTTAPGGQGGLSGNVTGPSTSAPGQNSLGNNGGPKRDREGVLSQALADLVQKGTITQAQADAVRAAVQARLAQPGTAPGGRFGFGHPEVFLREAVQTAADAIGVTPQDLTNALRSGQSVADVARSKNVDPQRVTDALVAKANAAVDQAVQNGKLTADRAAQIRAKLPQLAQDVVNRPRGHR